MRELEERLNICEEIKKNYNIKTLLKERDEFKEKYLTEWKKNNQTRVLLESQRRLISSPSFVINNKSKADFSSKMRSTTSEKKFLIKSTNNFSHYN